MTRRTPGLIVLTLLLHACPNQVPPAGLYQRGGPTPSLSPIGSVDAATSPQDVPAAPDDDVAAQPELATSVDPSAPDPGGSDPGEAPPDLCFGPWDCDDDDACTWDRCVAETNTCEWEAVPLCCNAPEDCGVSGQCTKVECVEHECEMQLISPCCHSDVECADGNPCTVDQCVADPVEGASCQHPGVPGCCAAVFENDFSWPTMLADWPAEQTVDAVSWQVWDYRTKSPPGALYMGNSATGDYTNGLGAGSAGVRVETSRTTPLILVPEAEQAQLSFHAWVDIETCEGLRAGFDVFRILVDSDLADGVVAFDKCDLDGFAQWEHVEIPLGAWAGQAVRLRFDFDSVDGALNDGEGIFIDDLEVRICY